MTTVTRRAAIGSVLGLLLALFSFSHSAQASDSEQDAAAFIDGLAQRAVESLTSADVPESERIARARTLLNENFAIPAIGQWILGRHWRRATPEEQAEYLVLFEDMIISIYVERFNEYSGQRLKVLDAISVGDRGDSLVSSQLERAGGAPINVDWRVRQRDGKFKVIDVMVAGVSMGQTQRAEFSAVIRNNGGEISGLLEEMRRRSQAVRERQG
jgi:phospholipid transport system substrate-binding protein